MPMTANNATAYDRLTHVHTLMPGADVYSCIEFGRWSRAPYSGGNAHGMLWRIGKPIRLASDVVSDGHETR